MKKGSITIFCSLCLLLIVTIVSALLNTMRLSVARTELLSSVDKTLFSTFSHYEKSLFQRYHLFFLDANDSKGNFALEKIIGRADNYLLDNLQDSGIFYGGQSGGAGIQDNQVDVFGYQLATDYTGEAFKRQAITYASEVLGADLVKGYVDEISNYSNMLTESHNITGATFELKEECGYEKAIKDYDKELVKSKENKEKVTKEENSNEEETYNYQPIENPIDTFKELKKNGVLNLVVGNTDKLSHKNISKQEQLSSRSLERGIGIKDATPLESITDKALFCKYIEEHFGCYGDLKEETALSYELEYIIAGEGGDLDNLKSVVHKLLLMREGSNLLHIYKDPIKRGKTKALASTIATSLGIPVAMPIIEGTLNLCWAYGESLLDVKVLLEGGKINFIKTNKEWKLSLVQLPNIMNVLKAERKQNLVSNKKGMNYKEYLGLLLFLGVEKYEIKCLDLIEKNIRMGTEKKLFSMDHCLESLDLQYRFQLDYKKIYTVRRSYGYNM